MLHACIKPVKPIKSPPLFFLFYFFPSFEGDESLFGFWYYYGFVIFLKYFLFKKII